MFVKQFLLISLLSVSCLANAQSYKDSILAFRRHYVQEFLEDERSPLKAKDTAFLRFYPVDKSYRVIAEVSLTPAAEVFDIETHSGKKKRYRQFALLSFRLNKKQYKLEVYQSQDLMNKPGFEDHLFIPFNDLTNYEESYAGGRYIDLSLKDIKDGRIVLDFNKCYNPYCAFADGYSCPIPPVANRLKVSVRAGEKLFGKIQE